jgi:hypothetical protein
MTRVAEPLLPHAVEAVKRMAARWPLGLASSSNLPVIELALQLADLSEYAALVAVGFVRMGPWVPTRSGLRCRAARL